MNVIAYYSYYNANGNKIAGKDFKMANEIREETGVAIVEDMKDRWFLIDEGGNRMSESYDSLSLQYSKLGGERFYVGELGNNSYLINKDGEVVAEGDSGSVYEYYNGSYYRINGDRTKILKDGTEIITISDPYASLSDGFIEVIDNVTFKHDFYTYSGKLICSYVEGERNKK